MAYIFGLDMGLGKTAVSMAFAEANNCTKCIVVSINAKAIETIDVKGSWLDWASKSGCNYQNYYNKDVFKKPTKKNPKVVFSEKTNDVLLINYEGMFERSADKKTAKVTVKKEIEEFILSCKGHNVAIIADECHKLKTWSSLQTSAFVKIQKMCKLIAKDVYTYIGSGTPFTAGLEDLYSQLKILGCQMNKETFKDKFCVLGHIGGLAGWQQPIIGYKNIDELYELIHQYALTIKSEEVLDLPDKIFVDHVQKETPEFKLLTRERISGNAIQKELMRRGYAEIPELNTKVQRNNPFYRNLAFPEEKWTAETVAVLWMRARQASIGFQGNAEDAEWYNRDRLDKLEEFLKEYPDNYLIFYNYTPELLELYSICEKLGYNIDVYSGEAKYLTFYEQYQKQSEAERLSNKKNVIIANFVSGSTGLNLQLYNKCIIFSVPLFKDYEQGIKRIHRLGQKDTCIYHLFYGENWLDRKMRKALDDKCQYNDDMFADDLKAIQEIKDALE